MATVIDLLLGVDLGQKRDPSAIAVLECEPRPAWQPVETHYHCRFLERLPLGSSYPTVAARVAEVERRAIETARQRCFERTGETRFDVYVSTFVDATGLGQPVIDLLTEAGVEVVPVFFTHGDRRTVERGQVTLGKAWLVARLQALLQTERLHLPARHPEAAALERELLDYEIRVSRDANDTYGAFAVGAHDDLVTALGLAAQTDHTADIESQRVLDAYWWSHR